MDAQRLIKPALGLSDWEKLHREIVKEENCNTSCFLLRILFKTFTIFANHENNLHFKG